MNPPQPTKTLKVDHLPVKIYKDADSLGKAAALEARRIIQKAIDERNNANIILATGNSQLNFLESLRNLEDIEWSQVRVFHMDEYLGIDPKHPASFPLFLEQHFLRHVNVERFFPIPGQPLDLEQACQEYTNLLMEYPADLVAMGWGENGHIAFNDPPFAEFNDPKWVKLIELAEASRKQQVNEGHFETLDQVPQQDASEGRLRFHCTIAEWLVDARWHWLLQVDHVHWNGCISVALKDVQDQACL